MVGIGNEIAIGEKQQLDKIIERNRLGARRIRTGR